MAGSHIKFSPFIMAYIEVLLYLPLQQDLPLHLYFSLVSFLRAPIKYHCCLRQQ